VTNGAVALVFPGQGAQAPGMGAGLVEAERELSLLDCADAAGLDLRCLVADGTAEQLRPTEVAQPALYYTGVALAQLFQEQGLQPVCAGGHSVGEFCALVAAGALDPVTGMELVLERGRLMAAAPRGSMAAVLGLEPEPLERICQEVSETGQCCVIANYNCPGQSVISGTVEGVEMASARARSGGARRVVALNVAGAFHSPLMAEAAQQFALSIDRAEIQAPRVPVVCGAEGRLVTTAAEVRSCLRMQLERPVQWTSSVRAMARAGVSLFVECGPGNTIASLIRRTLEVVEVVSVGSPEAVAELGPQLGTAGRSSPPEA
jgi:[acyl-carrier-protein] S-malonyltransferase